jgi:hypothetical protein
LQRLEKIYILEDKGLITKQEVLGELQKLKVEHQKDVNLKKNHECGNYLNQQYSSSSFFFKSSKLSKMCSEQENIQELISSIGNLFTRNTGFPSQ